jgi:hypothetical protein
MSSITNPGHPSISTTSVTATMFGCRNTACTRPSWSIRSQMDRDVTVSTFSA